MVPQGIEEIEARLAEAVERGADGGERVEGDGRREQVGQGRGRGGEEALALAEADVPFEIVPGVTAGVAAPAYAGIPVTHRGKASSVAFVTGHEDPTKDQSAVDWRRLATAADTIVVYMGVGRLGAIVAELLAGGCQPTTPAALVQSGTLPRQRVVVATLGEIEVAVQTIGYGKT